MTIFSHSIIAFKAYPDAVFGESENEQPGEKSYVLSSYKNLVSFRRHSPILVLSMLTISLQCLQYSCKLFKHYHIHSHTIKKK